MQFKKVDAYHAISECCRYGIARYNSGPESTYMAWRGTENIGVFTFAVERDESGFELPTYPARVDAFKQAMAACEEDAAAKAERAAEPRA